MIDKLETRQPKLTARRLPAIFSRQWLLSTVLVLAGMVVLVRLGFWQLDRLAQRQARNAYIEQQLALPPLGLSGSEALPADLSALNLRQAEAGGEFDFARQVALKAQTWQGAPGIHLITPLRLPSGEAVLVDRGWLPFDQSAPENWAQFEEPAQVRGFIRQSETVAGAVAEQTGPQQEWYRVDIEAIQAQLPYPLLPVFIVQTPVEASASETLPYRAAPVFDLSDGPHMGYAIQWFLFALVLGGGYIYYVKKETRRPQPQNLESR